jgi:hypothetical protein
MKKKFAVSGPTKNNEDTSLILMTVLKFPYLLKMYGAYLYEKLTINNFRKQKTA